MQWIHNYQLFLFDFDGLLVNTEEIHYLAYKRMLKTHGITLDWDFNRYCQAAHYDAYAIRNQIYALFPDLQAKEPDWTKLHAQKQLILKELFSEGAVQLMPGAFNFLENLQKSKIPCCVVTHSPQDLIKIVRNQNRILDSIPFWITREDYSKPKPDSECYLKAIELHGKNADKIIGFEDTPRGLTALLGTHVTPVLISKVPYPEISSFMALGAMHFSSLEDVKI